MPYYQNLPIMSNLAELEQEDLKFIFSHEEATQLLAILREANSYTLEKSFVQQLDAQQYFELTEEKPMTYSSFKNLKMVEEISAIKSTAKDKGLAPIKTHVEGKSWLSNISAKEPSQWLVDTLNINKKTPLISEKSLSEGLIRPILLELLRDNEDKFSLFSGETFDVNSDFGLTGECDFLLSLSREKNFIQAPIFALVEAKKKSIDEGLGQCAAQMIAARELNQEKDQELSAVFGCVSTGKVWRFLKLEENTLMIDEGEYYEKFELDKILGVLQYIVDFFCE